MRPVGVWTAASQHSALREPKCPPPLWSPASEGDDNTKVLHTGGWTCILWVSEQRPKQQRHVIQGPAPLTPPAFLTLLVVSANREVEHYWKHRGVFVYCQHKIHLLFSTILTVRGPPKNLVKKWWILAFVFTFQWLSTPVCVWSSFFPFIILNFIPIFVFSVKSWCSKTSLLVSIYDACIRIESWKL